MRVRVKFAKSGVMKFIGHLDVMRFFQKAIRRAGIDVAYTTGYSPHQVMSFAAPLGVGLMSTGEYMDIEVKTHQDSADMLNRLRAASVPGIEICSVKALPDTAGNAMASVAAAGYRAEVKEGRQIRLLSGQNDVSRCVFNFSCASEAASTFFAQNEIIVTKQTKKSEAVVDLRPGIFMFRVTQDGAIEMLVDASSAGNIKPDLLLQAFYSFAGIEVEPFTVQLIRLETYTRREAEEGSSHSDCFLTLEEVGYDF